MWVRKRLDIGWSDLAFGLTRALLPPDEAAIRGRLERRFSPAGDLLACLSVRSGFDLLLAALDLPAGSEVLLSAMTIPDMTRIIEAHQLVPAFVREAMEPDGPAVEAICRDAQADHRRVDRPNQRVLESRRNSDTAPAGQLRPNLL
jgi:dTDP-4-amino-4,6-dideoxygalactose transaminase